MRPYNNRKGKRDKFLDYLRNRLNPLLHSLAETLRAPGMVNVDRSGWRGLYHWWGPFFWGQSTVCPGGRGPLRQACMSSCISLLDVLEKQAFNVHLDTWRTQGSRIFKNLRFLNSADGYRIHSPMRF